MGTAGCDRAGGGSASALLWGNRRKALRRSFGAVVGRNQARAKFCGIPNFRYARFLAARAVRGSVAVAPIPMKTLPPPDLLVRQWLHNPDAITAAAFALTAAFLGVCAWLVARNLRHNEPGLRAPVAFLLALLVAGFGLFGASRLPSNWGLRVGGGVCV